MRASKARLTRLGRVRNVVKRTQGRNIHLRINLTLYSTALAGSTTRVEDDFCVHASEKNEADCPIRVAEDGAAQEDHLEIDGGFLTVSGGGSVELVHVWIGTVAIDSERGGCTECGGAKVGESRGGVAGLEVCLSVEVLGFDKGDVVVLGGGAYEDVCGDGFVVEDLDKVADMDVLPEGLGPVQGGVGVGLDRGVGGRAGARRDDAPDKGARFGAGEVWVGPGRPREDTDGGMVDAAVGLVAFNVLVCILDGGDGEDDDEGQDDEAGGDG